MSLPDMKDDQHRHAIQAEKPAEPWEIPGYFRLDCEPHRGTLLWWLGLASVALAIEAWIPCLVGQPAALSLPPAVLGVPLSVLTRRMVRRDQGRMRAGRMDRAGETQAVIAADLALGGVWLGTASLCWLTAVLIVSWRR